jgi:hypothetical protein
MAAANSRVAEPTGKAEKPNASATLYSFAIRPEGRLAMRLIHHLLCSRHLLRMLCGDVSLFGAICFQIV